MAQRYFSMNGIDQPKPRTSAQSQSGDDTEMPKWLLKASGARSHLRFLGKNPSKVSPSSGMSTAAVSDTERRSGVSVPVISDAERRSRKSASEEERPTVPQDPLEAHHRTKRRRSASHDRHEVEPTNASPREQNQLRLPKGLHLVFDTSSLIQMDVGILRRIVSRNSVTIPFIVINELDKMKKKFDDMERRGERDKPLFDVRPLREWFLQGGHPNLNFQSRRQAPSIPVYCNDDMVLACAIGVAQQYEHVYLCTEDRFLTLKASGEGIGAINLQALTHWHYDEFLQ